MIKPHLYFLLIRPMLLITRILEIVVVSGGLVVGMYIPVSGQEIVGSSASPESLSIGDRFLYVNTVEVPSGIVIEPVPLGDSLGDATVISPLKEISQSPEGTVSYACSLSVYRSGEIDIPSFTFAVTDSTGETRELTGQSLKVNINSVLPADTAGLDIADIKEPYRLRGPIWPYIVIPLGFAVIIYAAYKLYRRMQGEQEIPQAPPRPPWEVAFEELDALKTRHHLEYGRIKQYFFELSLIVRRYLEGRFQVGAIEKTTYELEIDTELKSAVKDHYDRLFAFFYRADLAKFAKSMPSRFEAESDLAFAYDFVKKTIPIIEEPVTQSQITAGAEA